MFNPTEIRIENPGTYVNDLFKFNITNISSLRLPTIEFGSRLIESILLRVPIGSFWFDRTKLYYPDLTLIDGGKRYLSILNFKNDIFALNDMKSLNGFKGYTHSNLPRHLQRRIEETIIEAYFLGYGTSEEAVQYIIECVKGL